MGAAGFLSYAEGFVRGGGLTVPGEETTTFKGKGQA